MSEINLQPLAVPIQVVLSGDFSGLDSRHQLPRRHRQLSRPASHHRLQLKCLRPIREALRSAKAANACGVCTATSVDRSGVDSTCTAVGSNNFDGVGDWNRRDRPISAVSNRSDDLFEKVC